MMNTRIARRSLAVCMVIVLLTGSLATPQHLHAEITGFAGRAYHIVTNEPVAGALISVDGEETVTDDLGWYRLALLPGRYTVSAQAAGYIGMAHTLQPVSEALTTVDFAMIPEDPDEAMNARIVEALDIHQQEISVEVLAQAEATGYTSSAVTQLPATIRLAVRENPAIIDSPIVEIITLDFEEYIKGVLPAEMGPSYPLEALKAQAVAARSYAASNFKHVRDEVPADVCSSVHCQVWRPTRYATTDRAVDETRGVAATYNGTIISAFFHGHCDGNTRNSEDVWSAALPYCRAVPCTCGYTTRWGHGVGMCQEGARAMANAGATYDQIVRHYYTGVNLLSAPASTLTEGRVEPASGGESTIFTFRVRYYTASGTPPPMANVIVDGRAQTMTRDGGSASTGWTYSYAARLAPGTHSYRFEFDDGYGRLARLPASGTWAGPVVTAESPAPPPSTVLQPHLTASTALDWAGGQLSGARVVAADKDVITLSSSATGTYTSPVLTANASFVAYGISWFAETPGTSRVAFEARSSLDGTSWSTWRVQTGEAYVPGNNRLQSAALVFGEARHLQYRVTLTAGSGGEAPALRNVRITTIDSRPGPQSADFDAPVESAALSPTIISRAGWGANESWMTWAPVYRTVKAMILHHTVTVDGGLDPAWVVRAIYRYHAIDREWGDIGYNYLVDHLGRIYEGRYGGPGVVGAHASEYNWGSVGIGMIGDFHSEPIEIPAAQYNAVTTFLAYQCSTWNIDPVGNTYLIDRWVPTIIGHRDVKSTSCPGQYFYPLLPSVRTHTLAAMTAPPPTLTLTSPASGQTVRGIVPVKYTHTSVVTRMSYYVDGVLRAQEPNAFAWKWNTTLYGDGPHALRVVVENQAGSSEQSVTVNVDNTPPTGTVSAPAWTSAFQIPVTVTNSNASGIAFSPGWTWEGEKLSHAAGTGMLVADANASQGLAWLGRGGIDSPGAWYGPYTCVLPPTGAYEVLYTLKTDHISASTGLATVDIADGRAGITYGWLGIAANDFGSTGYQEFALPLAYSSATPSCTAGTGGLEFRTWYSGQGNLWLDRVRVFTAPVAMAGTHTWPANANEGAMQLTVRLLDPAGNATERVLTIGIDRTAPQWVKPFGSGYWALDSSAGMNMAQGAWRQSFDGGTTWAAWQPLSLNAPSGSTGAVLFYTAAATGNRVQYKAVDRAGNESLSPILVAGLGLPPLDHTLHLPVVGH